MERRFGFRAGVFAAIAMAPVVTTTWLGCSSDESRRAADTTPPNPGGTFGAEVLVAVTGEGRITSNPGSLNCPSGCFGKFIFDANSDGAKAGVTLTATPTKDWRFAGWQFKQATPGTRGSGADNCNPITRPTAPMPAGVDLNSATITLTPGQVDGTPPKGQEGACAGNTKVPIAYELSASFVYAPAPDGGPDAGDDGGPDADGGGDAGLPLTPLYPGPVSYNATGGKIFYRSNKLYWQLQSSGQSAIESGYTTSGSTRTEIYPLGSSVTAFDASSYGLTWQTSAGSTTFYSFSYQTLTSLSSLPSGCSGVTSDSSYVYCRMNGNLYRSYWYAAVDGGTSQILYSGLPLGGNGDLTSDSSYLYYDDSTSVYQASDYSSVDGGTPSYTTIGSGQSSPSQLLAYSPYVYWLGYDSFSGQTTIYRGYRSSASTPVSVVSAAGIKSFTVDSSYVYYTVVPSSARGASSIWKASSSGGGASTMIHGNLYNPGGIATDSSRVYWTEGDGAVYAVSAY